MSSSPEEQHRCGVCQIVLRIRPGCQRQDDIEHEGAHHGLGSEQLRAVAGWSVNMRR